MSTFRPSSTSSGFPAIHCERLSATSPWTQALRSPGFCVFALLVFFLCFKYLTRKQLRRVRKMGALSFAHPFRSFAHPRRVTGAPCATTIRMGRIEPEAATVTWSPFTLNLGGGRPHDLARASASPAPGDRPTHPRNKFGARHALTVVASDLSTVRRTVQVVSTSRAARTYFEHGEASRARSLRLDTE